jgi:undecaprenyl-phosphate 4-deoxy-4-formamido-L-arabinose transferase
MNQSREYASKVQISVVIPCYRSESALEPLVKDLLATLSELELSREIDGSEVLLVVDGSPDRTAAVARDLEAAHDRVRALILRRNFGQHNALIAGIRSSRYDVIVTMDDDFQHPPSEISKLVAALRDSDVDLIYAVPEREEHGAFRSASSRLVKRGLALAGVNNAEIVGAFRAFRTDLREGFKDSDDPQVNLDVFLSWTTNRVIAVNVRMDKRAVGTSSYNLRRLVRHTLNMVTGYGTVPLRIATWLGLACGVFGFALLAWVLVRFALGETTVPGFTTLAALVSLFSGAQMVSIGIIGEYLGRQHFRSMRRPMYVIRTPLADSADQGGGAP